VTAFASCQSNERAIAGGYTGLDQTQSHVANDHADPSGRRAWEVQVRNTNRTPDDFFVLAVCVDDSVTA
jgi:hypothetical protein